MTLLSIHPPSIFGGGGGGGGGGAHPEPTKTKMQRGLSFLPDVL